MVTVQTGLAYLIRSRLDVLAGKRVGLVTHPAAVLSDFTHCVDALCNAGVRIVALFGPEHGFNGAMANGAGVGDAVDAHTGLPIYSLYGTTKSPVPATLWNIDMLVFDMQDVGVRFYTFISTLFYVLKSAAEAHIPVVVLDRPNPINGIVREGPLMTPGFESFVGIASIPLRYGLTIGELARYINDTRALHADLTVIAMQGWQREMWFDDTSLSWVPTSPAMPHTSTATVYPGMCLLEGTNASEGRGTALPFEVCGAPWIDGYTLARHLNERALSGVRFRPTTFVPSASKFAGEICSGVQIHVTNRATFRPVSVGLHLLAALKVLYPAHFAWREQRREDAHPPIDLLMGTDQVRKALDAGSGVDDIVAGWRSELEQFAAASRPYQLYS